MWYNLFHSELEKWSPKRKKTRHTNKKCLKKATIHRGTIILPKSP